MNDAKCKRGLRVPAASITLLHLLQREVKCEFVTAAASLAALCYPALLFRRPAFRTDITVLGSNRGRAEISRLWMLSKLAPCSVFSLRPHVLCSKQFVYPSLTLGQQNGHFLRMCVFVCTCIAGSSSYPFSGGLTG